MTITTPQFSSMRQKLQLKFKYWRWWLNFKVFVDQTKTKIKQLTKNATKRAVNSNVTSIHVIATTSQQQQSPLCSEDNSQKWEENTNEETNVNVC